MINQYHKTTQSFDTMIQQLGQKLIDMQEHLDDIGDRILDEEEVLERPKLERNQDGKGEKNNPYQHDNLMNIISTAGLEKNKVFSLRSQNLSFEVDFNVFESRFWPRVR